MRTINLLTPVRLYGKTYHKLSASHYAMGENRLTLQNDNDKIELTVNSPEFTDKNTVALDYVDLDEYDEIINVLKKNEVIKKSYEDIEPDSAQVYQLMK